jgi:hypothetical protein
LKGKLKYKKKKKNTINGVKKSIKFEKNLGLKLFLLLHFYSEF